MENFIQNVFAKYDNYLNKNILHRRFKHQDLIKELKTKSGKFELKIVGKSFEDRDICSVKIGEGLTKILIWSQMHGNEPTATLALLDIFNFFCTSDEFDSYRNEILKKCTLVFVPMLNPDGAELFIRRNAQFIDLNRDAERLAAPESQILKNIRDELNADFGFNMHDQELYYGVANSGKASALAFLAPSYNFEKEINSTRERAINVIAGLNFMLQKFIPQHIAKYSDTYMPNAFGDSMQRWGTSTILIESGYYKNDFERQFVRKLNFITLISAFYSIATKNFNKFTFEEYEKIPVNTKDAIFDYLIKNVTIVKKTKKYIADIGISRDKSDKESFTDYFTDYLIWDIGDLSGFSGHNILDFCFHDLSDIEDNIKRFSNADFLIKKYFKY
jgi:hypothetical protein